MSRVPGELQLEVSVIPDGAGMLRVAPIINGQPAAEARELGPVSGGSHRFTVP
jgi:hypothetical protein